MKRSRLPALTLAALATACSPVPPAPPPAVPTSITTAEPTAAPAPPPPPAKAAEPALPAGPFHAVATVTTPSPSGELDLFTLGPELFVGRGHDGRQRLFHVRDGAISRDEVTMPGRAGGSSLEHVRGLHGRWPDRAYLVTVSLDGGGRYHNTWNLFRRDPVAQAADSPHRGEYLWRPILQHNDPNYMVAQNSPEFAGPSWDGELAIMSDGRVVGRFNDRLRVLDGPEIPVPRLTVAAACKGHARVAFGDWNESSRLLALPSGHLVVAGKDCAEEGIALERFAPGAVRGDVVTFGKECALHKVVGTKIDALTIWAQCKGDHDVLFGFDGKQASPIAYPGSTINAITLTAAGVLHVVDHGAHVLHERSPGGAWQAIPLGDAGGEIAVIGEDDVWMFDGATLWRNKVQAGPPQAFVWPADDAQVATSFRAPRAATSACESIYVLFFAFARTTPEGYDFPLTRAALKGHTELEGARLVVTRDGGRKYFGAFAPSLDVARKLAATVQRGVADAHPEILCAKPELVREIDINWTTGAVEK